jgi:perosamine synthetase
VHLRNRINLIPRNNWDYGFTALFGALTHLSSHTAGAPNIENIFRLRPIWTNTGRTSLYAILKALDLPQGAKVGVPLFCCSVVFNAICQADLTPCFIDSNLSDGNIAAEDLKKKRADLAAVIAVHMFGNPCDMDAILTTAGSIPVIEDCAQSLFSKYKGKQTGLLSTASFFSFRCGKYISAGEGSAIFCQDSTLHKKIEQIVNSFESCSALDLFAQSILTFTKAALYNRPWYGILGYPVGMRLDKKLNLTAKEGFKPGKIAPTHLALIDERIAYFQDKINLQVQHANLLLNSIRPADFIMPSENDNGSSNWFQFALRFHNAHQRDAMANYLFTQGIDTAKYLDGIAAEARTHYGYRGDCPNADLLSQTVLLIPIHYTLHLRDIEHIARSINQASRLI